MAMAPPVSELIHNLAVLALLAVPTVAGGELVTAPSALVRLPTLLLYYISLNISLALVTFPVPSSVPLTQTCPLLPPVWP